VNRDKVYSVLVKHWKRATTPSSTSAIEERLDQFPLDDSGDVQAAITDSSSTRRNTLGRASTPNNVRVAATGGTTSPTSPSTPTRELVDTAVAAAAVAEDRDQHPPHKVIVLSQHCTHWTEPTTESVEGITVRNSLHHKINIIRSYCH
jgi:hypothetical protein